MKKLLAGLVVAASLITLTGCGMYGKPGNPDDVKTFKQFSEECTDAGGRLEEGPRDWYTCEMGGAG